VALNSLGFNIARSVGPAAGGLLLAALGAAVAHSADVVSDLVVVVALAWWRHSPSADDELSERFLRAFRAGFRFVRSSRELHVVLMRSAIFFAFLSAPVGRSCRSLPGKSSAATPDSTASFSVAVGAALSSVRWSFRNCAAVSTLTACCSVPRPLPPSSWRYWFSLRPDGLPS
jgi:transmembrane secretion effector